MPTARLEVAEKRSAQSRETNHEESIGMCLGSKPFDQDFSLRAPKTMGTIMPPLAAPPAPAAPDPLAAPPATAAAAPPVADAAAEVATVVATDVATEAATEVATDVITETAIEMVVTSVALFTVSSSATVRFNVRVQSRRGGGDDGSIGGLGAAGLGGGGGASGEASGGGAIGEGAIGGGSCGTAQWT